MQTDDIAIPIARLLLCVVLGFTLTWCLIPLICHKAKQWRFGGREHQFHHSHGPSIPRFGGLALVLSFAALVVALRFMLPPVDLDGCSQQAIILGALAMFGLGFWDDLRPLGAKIKLGAQVLIASAIYAAGIQIQVVQIPFWGTTIDLGILSYLATVLWLVALTNLINLIDGIDGLAGGVGFILMLLLAHVGANLGLPYTTLLTTGIAAALLGFIYFNFPPAKVYMGDGGAYFLGFLIGMLSIVHSQKGSVMAALIVPLFALALPIVDVSFAILRRGLTGLPLFRPDRHHLHHLLLRFGFSRRRAVLILYSISIGALFLALGVFWSQGRLVPLMLGFLFVALMLFLRGTGMVKEWFPAKNYFGSALTMRAETRYALILSQWLEMESERRTSVKELWEDFQFVARKLGFSEVLLILPDETNIWRASVCKENQKQLLRAQFNVNGCGNLHFAADPDVLSVKLFNTISELAAEGWVKAASRWRKLNQIPLRFNAVANPETSLFQRQQVRPYSPGTAELWVRSHGVQQTAK